MFHLYILQITNVVSVKAPSGNPWLQVTLRWNRRMKLKLQPASLQLGRNTTVDLSVGLRSDFRPANGDMKKLAQVTEKRKEKLSLVTRA